MPVGPNYSGRVLAPIEPTPVAGMRFGIAAARFNEEITSGLLSGAMSALTAAGVREGDVTLVWVPGALELPLACRWLAETARFDAVLALGCVLRGETDHYEHVCTQAARGVLDASLATSVPVGFGVLTRATFELAMARAGDDADNKGGEAARAALAMAALRPAIARLSLRGS